MSSAICTLFEGHYHYGVGALANSLYAHGFRGTIYVGYRGPLPPWVDAREARSSEQRAANSEHGVEVCGQSSVVSGPKPAWTDFSPAGGLTLRFIPLTPKIHLTNYKPDFMLEVWEKHCPQAEALFYFDPDITIKCRWAFFEEWVEAGVAVCTDVNPSMSANHPIRHAWKKAFHGAEIGFRNQFDTYFNGGAVGVSKQERHFLELWQKLISMIGEKAGGLGKMIVAERSECFYCPDQDALNIACMATDCAVSPVGQDGMDIQHGGGGYIMSHAIGGAKPWKKSFVQTVLLRASPPSRADKEYFQNVESPIRLYPPAMLAYRRLLLKAASFLGRFMRNM